jgi:hypothetical protein
MNSAELLDIADHAARYVVARSCVAVTGDDLDDMRQAAVTALLSAQQHCDRSGGYLFVVAKRQALDWLYWWMYGRPWAHFIHKRRYRWEKLPDDLAEPSPARCCLSREQIGQLVRVMRARGHKAGSSRRYARCLAYIAAGYDIDWICRAEGMTRASWGTYKARIRAALGGREAICNL